MKKLLIAIFSLIVAIPLKAADFDIYGRFAPGAWFTKSERFYDDSIGTDSITGETILGNDTLPLYYCTLWPYGTMGIKYKSDKIGVCFEIGVRQGMFAGRINDEGGSIKLVGKEIMKVEARNFYAQWFINDWMTLLLGKTDGPACFTSSKQRFYGTNSFRNTGSLYTGSNAMFQLAFGKDIFASDVESGFLWEAKIATVKVDTARIKFQDVDEKVFSEVRMPKFEGSFAMRFEKDIFMTMLELGGGYQQYTLACQRTGVVPDESKEPVHCAVSGFEYGVKVGPVKAAYNWAWGHNMGSYGAKMGNPFVWRATGETNGESFIVDIFFPYHVEEKDSSGVGTGNWSIANGRAVEMCWILNIAPWEWLSLEGGYGYVHAEHDRSSYDSSWSDTRAYYAGIQWKVADILSINPEFGQYWYGNKPGFGRFTYWGLELAVEF